MEQMDVYKTTSGPSARHTQDPKTHATYVSSPTSTTQPSTFPTSKLADQGSWGSSAPSAPPLSDIPSSGTPGFMGMVGGTGSAAAQAGSPQGAAEMLRQQKSMTAEKMARGILAIADMTAASINNTATALGGALTNYSNSLMSSSPPLSQPLTISKSYVSRLSLLQMFTQPLAQGAQLVASYAGELLYYILQAAFAVYTQLAAMKVLPLPQITTVSASDPYGVPVNPVRGGVPLAVDELAAFKLVGAALLMAYVQVYDALEEAAQLLFRQAASAGERYLAHRHGGEAADVATAALSVASDLLLLTLNWFRLLGRGLVSKAAANTARGFLMNNIPDLHLD